MAFYTKTLHITTQTPLELINLTSEIQQFVQTTGIENGLCVVSTQHTTVALKINEECPYLRQDFLKFFQSLVPPQLPYSHNAHTLDGRPNAHSHLLAMFLEANQTIPIVKKQLQLGTWQSIFMIELDGPRPERKVLLTVWGDSD